MATPERDTSGAPEHRDAVIRTVVFSIVSLAAWWGWSSVASADDTQADDHAATDAATEVVAPAPTPPQAPPAPAAPTVPTAPAARTAPEAPGAPSTEAAGPTADPQPVLFPTVVEPLVNAVTPALNPVGEVVYPLIDAVTTPIAPLVATVSPVVDQTVGPVVGPVAGPVMAVVAPVVEQVATSAAPVVQLAAPVVVPVAKPVVAVVAPVVDDVLGTVSAPVVAATQPVLQNALAQPARLVPDQPATRDAAIDRAGAALGRALTAPAPLSPAAGSVAPVAERSATGSSSVGADAAGWTSQPSAAPTAAPAPVPQPPLPFRDAVPAPGTVVMSQSGCDSCQRGQRLAAVFSSTSGLPEARMTALSRVPVVEPLARFGGRPPVTPD
jgi:hypothetical protein